MKGSNSSKNSRLFKLMSYFLGLMSGTSRDSLDICCVSFEPKFKVISNDTLEFSESYKSTKNKTYIDNEITLKSIEAVNNLIKKNKIKYEDIECIAFPGQTLLHTKNKSFQAGNAHKIAKETKLTVRYDFRNQDISQGGLGAPLVPSFHNYLFGEINKSKMIVNIGGICNATHLKGNHIQEASDIGPGNCLMDFYCIKNGLGNFDLNGRLASQGRISKELFKALRSTIQFDLYPRADDIANYLIKLKTYEKIIDKTKTEDVLRTLIEITVLGIEEFYRSCGEPEEIIVHGGGIYNKFLMNLLSVKFGNTIKTSANYLDPKFVEAAAFAYLAYLKKGVLITP